jgi:poly-gamma-glutamate synthesis protein (capsule biosynthesis protein)
MVSVLTAACEQRLSTAEVKPPEGGPVPSATEQARAAEVAPPPPERLVILAVGDIGLGRWVGKRILGDPQYDPFAHIAPLLQSADLVLGNLESQLSDQGGQTVHPANYLVFTGPPAGAGLLAAAGFDYVSVANNHTWDYGQKAFFETLDHLEQAKVAYSGGGRLPADRFAPAIVEHGDWSVAIFAVTHIWNQPPYNEHPGRHHVAWATHAAFAKPLEQARVEHDVVLMNYHGGGEYMSQPIPRTVRFFDQTLDSGVDAVLGHHPHVPQGIRFTNGRPGLYSLGNFVFEPFFSHWTYTGLVARLTFERDVPGMPAQVQLCPVAIGDDDRPRLFGALKASTRERRLAALRRRLRETSTGPITIGEPGEHGCMTVASAPAG